MTSSRTFSSDRNPRTSRRGYVNEELFVVITMEISRDIRNSTQVEKHVKQKLQITLWTFKKKFVVIPFNKTTYINSVWNSSSRKPNCYRIHFWLFEFLLCKIIYEFISFISKYNAKSSDLSRANERWMNWIIRVTFLHFGRVMYYNSVEILAIFLFRFIKV